MKADIEEAIQACKNLKRAYMHTEMFWVHQSQLTVLEFLKKAGFQSVSIKEEEDVQKHR
jgi:hypothetical protein